MDPRIRSLQQALSKGPVSPIYLVDGEETLLIDEAAKLIERAALGDGLRDFNLDRFQLGESGADAILNALATLPMMAERRVVLVRCPKSIDDGTLEALAKYAESPSPRATLLLVVVGKVNANLKLPRAVKKLGGLYRFEPLKPREVPAWIIDHTTSIGFAIRPDAAAMLADVAGSDLLALSTHIDKLIAYTAGERPIERGDVEAVVERTREEVIWDLTDAVGEGNLQKALGTLDNLLEHAQSPIAVAAMITRHLRQLWIVKCAARRGLAPDVIATEHKIHPFVAKKLVGQAHRFDDDTLKAHFDRLFRADRDLKSSKLDDSLIMERLVFELCTRAPSPGRR